MKQACKIDFDLVDSLDEIVDGNGVENVLYSLRQVCIIRSIKDRADKKWRRINQALRRLLYDNKIFDQK